MRVRCFLTRKGEITRARQRYFLGLGPSLRFLTRQSIEHCAYERIQITNNIVSPGNHAGR